MFFGLHIKASQKQAKPIHLDEPLKLGQAVLEPTKSDQKEPVTLLVEHQGQQFILCVLDPKISWQSSLDIMFAAGSDVKFFTRGSGKVHLTGYRLEDDMAELDMSCSSDEEEPAQGKVSNQQESSIKKKTAMNKTNGVAKTTDKKKANGKMDTINDLVLSDDTSSDDVNYPDLEDDFFTDDDGEVEDEEDDDIDDDDDEDEEDDDEDDDDDDDEEEEEGEEEDMEEEESDGNDSPASMQDNYSESEADSMSYD